MTPTPQELAYQIAHAVKEGTPFDHIDHDLQNTWPQHDWAAIRREARALILGTLDWTAAQMQAGRTLAGRFS